MITSGTLDKKERSMLINNFIASFHQHFENFTHQFVKTVGSAKGFIAAFISLVIWLIVGNAYEFSNRWENTLSIYIGSVTFLMIFLMQRSQNKELAVIHIKLNELISASTRADNNLISAGELTESEISEVQAAHRQIVQSIQDKTSILS